MSISGSPAGFDDGIGDAHDIAAGFANVANLRAFSGTAGDGEVRYLKGYTNTNDGGQGPLYNDNTDTTTADNNGSVFVDASGHRWKRFD